MQFREHLSKLSWTALDKLLFILYGFVTLIQIKVLNNPEAYGLASQLITLQTWIFIVTDGSALQSIIQFGVQERDRGKANFYSLLLHVLIALGLPLLVMTLNAPLTSFFKEERFSLVSSTLPLFCLLTLPRSFCLKLMQRDLRMRDVFFTNLAWFGTMGVMTVWMIQQGSLQRYEDMAAISLWGVGISSVVALVLARRQLIFSLRGSISFTQVLRFGLPQALIVSLNNLIRQLDIFLVQLYFGLAAAGIYTSAKMIYRVFETAADAGIGLMYPTAVRLFAQDRTESVITIFSKAISFLLVGSIAAVICLEAGMSRIIIGFLGERYAQAVPQFNVMVLGALFLPFFILQSVELAQHYTGKLLRHVVISVVVGLVVFYLLGKWQYLTLYPLGVVAYSASFALLLALSVRNELHFPLSHLFRAIPDALSFVRSLKGKKV